ncbi:MAG: hypothetical protein ACK4V1_00840 [Burkholderiaceae bacterium]
MSRRAIVRAAALAALGGFGATLGAQPLPRLFFTPEERHRIEAQRAGGVASGATVEAHAPETRVLQVQGAVRARGRGVVGWIDGQKRDEGSRVGDFVARFTDGAARLHRADGPELEAPVGARVDAATGRVYDEVTVVRSRARGAR